MKFSSFIGHNSRRFLSLALFVVAFCLFAFLLRAQTSSKAAVAVAPAVGNQTVPGEAPDVAAFRQSVGGSITPLIIELKGEPGVLRKLAAEKKGGPLALQQIFSQAQELAGEQDAFRASLAQRGVRALMRETDVTQIDGSVRHIQYRFTYLLNGFVAFVATDDIDRLKALPEVAHVSEPQQVQFFLNNAVDYSLGTQTNVADRRTAVYGPNKEFNPPGSAGHPETPASTKLDGFEGQNMNIAVIDTGVDYRHPMFGGTGLDTPVPRVSGQPESPDDNTKVIYFYAFSQPVGDPTDDFGHGTLVASCAAGFSVDGTTPPRFGYGLGVNPPLGVGPTPNGVQLFGTAPQARIMAYKVCGPANACLGDIELSIEDAASPFTLVAPGTTAPTPVAKPVADVINLSLGDTAGDPAGSTSRIANNAALAGTIMVASAGNAGPGPGTIGAPSAATLAISVAASLDPGSVAGGDVLGPDQVPADLKVPGSAGPPPERGALSKANTPQPGERQGIKLFPVAGGGPIPEDSLSAHYVYVNQTGNPVTPPSVQNRIALVRGTGAFANIANAIVPLNPAAILIITAVESATAVVVVNNIPTYTISLADAGYLLDILAEGDDDSVDPPHGAISRLPMRIGESVSLPAFQGSMAGFSSRGPNDHANANFRTIKPDVTGPGVAIVGAATVEGIPDETVGLASTTGYTQANGTSFSGPITAGGMALIRQRVREELNLDTTNLAELAYRAKRFDTVTVARALLQNSATNLRNGFGVSQGDGAASVASVNDMGSGHINLAAALTAKAIMVAPTPLLTDPQEFNSNPPASTPLTVMIPTASFGAVPVIGFNGTVERFREVIIRDVTGGQGGGVYNLSVQNHRLLESPGFQVSFTAANGSPITSVSVPASGQASFFVRTVADGMLITTNPTEFQWYVTATATSGQTLRMPFYYRAVPAPPVVVTPAQLQNISTRLHVQTGDNVGIAGFIITGPDPKQVGLRGMGPSVTINGAPVPGRMEDPMLELYDQNGTFIVGNDDWRETQEDAIRARGLAPGDTREAVILRTLSPAQYTAIIKGKGGGTGIGLIEAYDLDQTGPGKFANISTRGFVQTGDNVMIGGFIVGRQTGPTNVVVRALGPSLEDDGVSNPLRDPTVELVNQNGTVIDSNDDFATANQLNEITTRGLAPEDPKESALFETVSPGNYTAIVRGKANSTGVGLVEVYNVE
jgi:Subtilase family